MRIIYTFGIRCYALGVRVAAWFGGKPRQMVAGWKATKARCRQVDKSRPTAWFHASSLGEFEQARPVLEAFKQQHPDYRIWVTFFSPSGYEIRKNYAAADVVCYLPMDTPKNARRLIEAISPTVAFFVKYDFWFNCLEELRRHQVPTYLFSAIFRPEQYFFKWYGGWYARQLKRCFTHLFVQNEESIQLLNRRGVTQCSIAGDTRFDRVQDIAQAAREFPAIAQFIGSDSNTRTLMAGSSWEPDEEYLKPYLDNYPGDLKLVLAPHVIDESHLRWIENLFGEVNCVRYSTLDSETPSAPKHTPRVLIIDNIGMLSSIYRYADVAYIGGGWGKGIHNVLEAIVYGKPVAFGPRYQKFQEAREIVARGGGFSFDEYEQLEERLNLWFNDAAAYQQASGICLQYLQENLGSTQTILNAI